jgi:hypothetical protein
MITRKQTIYFFLLILVFVNGCATASDIRKDFNNNIKTEHFDFYFNGAVNNNIREIAKFSEGFLSVLKRDFFNPSFDYPIKVLIFPTRDTFQSYLRTNLGIANPPSFGIYLAEYKLFATYEESGLGTFAHEIMHPLITKNFPKRPVWADEGIPSFFEKFFGYWNGNDLVLSFGYQNPWRIEELGKRIDDLDLKTILYRTVNDYSINKNSDLRMVSVFLWRQGKFRRYLDLLSRNDRGVYGTFFEAALGKNLEEIVPIWRQYLRETKINRSYIYRIPPSKVFDNEESYNSFITFNHLYEIY